MAGVEILTLAIMQELAARGHAVHCLVSGWNDGDFVARLEEAGIGFDILKLGFVYLRRPLWTADTLLHYPSAVWRWRQAVRRFRPDIGWHANPRSALMLRPFLEPSRTVLHVHDRDHPSARTRAMYRLLAGKVSCFVAVSKFVGDHLTTLGVPKEKIRVILNGLADFSSPVSDRHGTARRPIRIGIVGQIIERKGHQDLLEALRELRRRGREFQCMVFGKGDATFQERLRRRAAATGLDEFLHWQGFVADRGEIYSQLDIAVVPTRDQEPFGLSALEPGFCGLPVVASRSGGLVEVLVDGETGLFHEPGDWKDLADQLEKLMVDPSLRLQFGDRARRRATRDFSLGRMIDEVESLLDSLPPG